MSNYFVLACEPRPSEAHFDVEVDASVRGKRWKAGILFSASDRREALHPPQEPISLSTVDDTNDPPRVYPEYSSQPIPLMSRRLVAAMQAAGVDNLQLFSTQLNDRRGDPPPAPDHYLAVNIVGCIAAADLARSALNPLVNDRLVSADFHSLAVAEDKTRAALLFRLAENVSAVLVHKQVKEAVERSGIDTLTWYLPREWAG